MKVLFWIPMDLSKPCAEKTHVLELSKELVSLGCKITVMCTKRPKVKKSAVSFVEIPKVLLHRGWNLILCRKVKNVLRNFNLVYSRNVKANLMMDIAVKEDIPIVLELNGVAPLESKMLGFENYEQILENELKCFQKATKIVAVSDGIKKFYASNGLNGKKISVVENGVNTNMFKPMDKKKCREGLKIKTGDRIITFVGDFRPWQGIELAIDAMKMIIGDFPEAELVVVGDSDGSTFKPTVEDLKKRVKSLGLDNGVIFSGKVPYTSVPKYIGASDICIAPFRRGRVCSALKILEYMSCNKSVLTTDIENYKDIIENNKFGLVVESDNVKKFADAAKRMLKSTKNFRNSRKFILENFTWRHTAEKILNIMGDVA